MVCFDETWFDSRKRPNLSKQFPWSDKVHIEGPHLIMSLFQGYFKLVMPCSSTCAGLIDCVFSSYIKCLRRAKLYPSKYIDLMGLYRHLLRDVFNINLFVTLWQCHSADYMNTIICKFHSWIIFFKERLNNDFAITIP